MRQRERKKPMEGATAPLDYLLRIMRDKDQDARLRLDAAKAAAPYCHARLSSTELSGPSGGPVSVQTSQKLDISGLNDEELDILAVQEVLSLAPLLARFPTVAPAGRPGGTLFLGVKREDSPTQIAALRPAAVHQR